MAIFVDGPRLGQSRAHFPLHLEGMASLGGVSYRVNARGPRDHLEKGETMPRSRGFDLFALLAAANLACSGDDLTTLDNAGVGSGAVALRDMTASEALEDLEQIFTLIRTLYGPYEYKEARFAYSIADLEDKARDMLADAPSDDGFYAAANWFLTRFDDGHVNLVAAPSSNPISNYVIGLFLQPVEGKALIAELLDPSLADLGIAFGDEVVAVDGVSPFVLLDEFRKLRGFGNPLSSQHLIFRTFIRPAFLASVRPSAPTASVDFRRADGSAYSRDLIWREDRAARVSFPGVSGAALPLGQESFTWQQALEINDHVRGSLATIGSPVPFFFTPQTVAAFDLTRVTPNAAMLTKYGIDPAAVPDIFSGLYSYGGKTLLLIRQGSYSAFSQADIAARLNYYRAVMDQFDNFVDGLVIDQTHNPGGFISYCVDFTRLFVAAPGRNFVQANNTDRAWINAFRDEARLIDPTLSSEEARSHELRAARIEAAYDAGQGISRPMPLYLGEELPPDPSYVWTKPKLVLIDELAGSCADAFPMLVKANGLAPLFGRRTIGLGGNVESFGPLSNSQASLSLTRSLFTTHQDDETYAPGDFVENNGVLPDIEHVITVADYRGGFVDYMRRFSQELVSRLETPRTEATDD
jgi:hypothetical protein